ncbi:MAG: vitamin K epoxide reductase family protein [Bacteroidia bacterium]|nr:vitamin K epoxide reductase family protein [Bacteroidia bacterium]
MIDMSLLATAGLFVSIAALRRQRSMCPTDPDIGSQCDTVTQAPQAALFAGIPNARIGIVWYFVLLLWSVIGILLPLPSWSETLITLGAAVSFGISVYLTIILLFVLRKPCALCYAAHAINGVIVLVLLW